MVIPHVLGGQNFDKNGIDTLWECGYLKYTVAVWYQRVQRCRHWSHVGLVEPGYTDSQAQWSVFKLNIVVVAGMEGRAGL